MPMCNENIVMVSSKYLQMNQILAGVDIPINQTKPNLIFILLFYC